MRNENFKTYQKPLKSSPTNKNAKFTISTVKKGSRVLDLHHPVQGDLAVDSPVDLEVVVEGAAVGGGDAGGVDGRVGRLKVRRLIERRLLHRRLIIQYAHPFQLPQAGAHRDAGDDLHVVQVIGHGIAAGCVVGVEAVIAGEIKKQPRFGGVRIGRQNRGGEGRRVLDGDLRACGRGKDDDGKKTDGETRAKHGCPRVGIGKLDGAGPGAAFATNRTGQTTQGGIVYGEAGGWQEKQLTAISFQR